MTWIRFAVLALLVQAPLAALAQEEFKVEPLKAAAPDGLKAPVREALGAEGARVLDPEGKPLAEVWLRKSIPATGKPSGAKGPILFPVLEEGELLGAVRFVAEGHDYRDQAIAPGVYTIRYGLQPVNGDHLGVSPYRDYAMLVPAAKDASAERLDRKKLDTQSAEAAGSSHPAILMLLAAPDGSKTSPSIARDEEKNTWGAVLSLPLTVKGDASPSALLVQLVVVGAAQ